MAAPKNNHYNSRLTESDIREIRKMWRSGETFGAIACRFGVNRDTARRVAHGITWKWVE